MIIEIIVSPTGETRLETKGFVGEACWEASGFLEAALGNRAGEQLTAEFHQAVAPREANRQRLQ